MTAYNLGFKDITCLNFSQPGYDDEITARKIADKLNLKLIFYSLEEGRYFLELDKNLAYNYGQVTLHGAGHLYAAINSLDFSNYGILHSGQLGDALLGTLLSAPIHTQPELKSGYYSDVLFDTYIDSISSIKDNYANQEMFLLYCKCFNAVMNGEHACAEISYSVSPFMEPEFAQFVLNIDTRLRYKYHCYKEWVRKENRLGASFPWERYGSDLLVPDWMMYLRKKARGATHRIIKQVLHLPLRKHMNPFDYWWKTNPELEKHFQNTPAELDKIQHLISPELYKDTANLFQSRTVTDKILAYTLITGLQYLYGLRLLEKPVTLQAIIQQ
jgi:asparagine synthase (glutamine-hydrolysing)